jgi:hypothetical protein
MTSTDMILRINDALRNGDVADLFKMAEMVDGLMMAEEEKAAWQALIETSIDTLEGNI